MATVEYETKARRRHYIARLDGADPKMGLRREFLSGVKVKTRRAYKHQLEPGFYEVQTILPVSERKRCETCGHSNDAVREYFAVTTAGAIEDLNDYVAEMDRISEGPPLDGPYVAEVASDGHAPSERDLLPSPA